MKKTNLLGAKVYVANIGNLANTYTGEARLVGYDPDYSNSFIVEIPQDIGWIDSAFGVVFMSGYDEIPEGHSLFYCGIEDIQIIVEEENTGIKQTGGIKMLENKNFIVRGINRNNVEDVANKITGMGYDKTMHGEDIAPYTKALIEASEDWTADLATGKLFDGVLKIADYIIDGFDEDDLKEIGEHVIIITAEDFLSL